MFPFLLSIRLQFKFYIDGRLTEQEALDEIRELCNQLQNLRDRVPNRGNAHSTISTLLDQCKPTSSNCLSLKPPLTGGVGKKQAAIMGNGNTTTATTLTTTGLTGGTALVQCADKSTNTNTIATTGNERWMLNPNHANGISTTCTRISITDDCDNRACDDDNNSNNATKQNRSLPLEMDATATNPAPLSEKSELSFGDLQLQCMCSDAIDIDSSATTVEYSDNCSCAPQTYKCLNESGGNLSGADSGGVYKSNHTGECSSSNTATVNECPNHNNQCKDHHRRCSGSAKDCALCPCRGSTKRASSMKKVSHRNASRLKTNLSMDCSRDVAESGLPATSYSQHESMQKRCEGGFGSTKSSLDDSEIPITPSPTVSSLSLGGFGVDDKISISDGNMTPSSPAPLLQPPMTTTTNIVPSSSISANDITATDENTANTDSTAAGNSTKRSKSSDSKLVIDLNDRSKYTKEVSV